MEIIDSPIKAAIVLVGVVIFVWIKVVQPIRGDLAWKRQTEHIELVKAERLARARKKKEKTRA